jgi:hypothetical protein
LTSLRGLASMPMMPPFDLRAAVATLPCTHNQPELDQQHCSCSLQTCHAGIQIQVH